MTEIRIRRLQDRIEQYEEVLGIGKSTTERLREIFGLEPERAVMLGLIYKREFVTRDGCYTVMYEGRPECDWPEEKVLDVHLCMVRKRLKPYGIKIVTRFGAGWFMPAESKAIVRAKLEASQVEMAAIAISTRRDEFWNGT